MAQDRLTEEVLRDQFIDVLGDGRIEITAGNPGTSNYTGTGTKVEVYDNVTNELVETSTSLSTAILTATRSLTPPTSPSLLMNLSR